VRHGEENRRRFVDHTAHEATREDWKSRKDTPELKFAKERARIHDEQQKEWKDLFAKALEKI
jgi:hypothetical protein